MLVELKKEDLIALVKTAFEEGAVSYSEMKEEIAEKLAEEFLASQKEVFIPPPIVHTFPAPSSPPAPQTWPHIHNPYAPSHPPIDITWHNSNPPYVGDNIVVNSNDLPTIISLQAPMVYGDGIVEQFPPQITVVQGSDNLQQLTIVGFDDEGYSIEAPNTNHGF